MRTWILSLALAICAVPAAQPQTSGSAGALPAGFVKGPTVEGITEYRIPNGLRVLLFPDNSKPTVTVNVTYMVGSKHENYGETGMAHLLEHLLFKGTPTSGNIMTALKDKGANFNGSTWTDRTNYFETLQSSDENLKWAISMEADRMVNSKIAKSDLDTEMTVVRNEFESGENSPMRVLMKRVESLAYDWHNYGKDTIGNRADIENVPIDRLQAFYRKYYQPDNAMLVVAGKFDQAKVLSWIADTFAKIEKPTRELPKLYTEEPTQDGERTVTVRRVGDVQILLAAYHIPAGTHPDYPAVDVLNQIMTANPAGRLYKALVDNRKASSVGGFGFQWAEPGLLMLFAQVPKADSLASARTAMLDTIAGVAKEPPTKEEVDRAKARLLKQIELSLTNSEEIGIELSEWAAMRDWRMLFIDRDRLQAVTPEDVQRVAKAYLKESNMTLAEFIPTEKPDRAEVPPAPASIPELTGYKGKQVIAQGEAFDPSPANIEKRLERGMLPSGMKLALLSKKTRGENVQALISLHFGDERILFGKSTGAQLAGRMLIRGTRNKNRQQIQDELDRLKARMNVGGGVTGATVSIETTRANLPDVLKLAAEVLREPSFPEQELETVRRAALTSIEQNKAEPMPRAFNEVMRLTSRYPKGDPRAAETFEEQIDDWKGVTLDQAKEFHHDFYGASNAEFIVVGDFDSPAIRKLAGELFGDWKSPKPYARVLRNYQGAEPVHRVIETPDKANAVFAAVEPLKLSDTAPDYAAAEFGNYMFGGSAGSRLMERLRQKEGWSYGAGSQLQSGTGAEEDGGMLMCYAILNPQNIDKLEGGFKEEVDKVIQKGFPADEVEKSRKSWLDQQVLMRSQDQALVRLLAEHEMIGRTMSFEEGVEKAVSSMTPEQVSAAFRKFLGGTGKLIYVRAGDFSKKPAAAAAPTGGASK